MHQQVRCSIQRTRGDVARGTLDEESLVDILTLLKGKNLRSAGRIHPGGDRGGEFVFSVDHREGDDTADQEARDILIGEGFAAEVYPVEHFVLKHEEGALLECIKRVEAKMNEPVIEVYVLAAERNGKVPVQLVTRSMLNR
jgi:hypothetical protein